MQRALLVSVAATIAACTSPPPQLKLVVAAGYSDLGCGTVENNLGVLHPTTVRLSARMKDAAGNTLSVCDALLSPTTATTEGFPTNAATIDLYVEAFGGALGTQRLATGALIGVDLTAGPLPNLRLFGAEQFRCIPDGILSVPRAFHTATTLPNGQILFVGGITTNSDGKDVAATSAADPQFFATSAVELYDPATRKLVALSSATDPAGVARAFHRAALISASGGRFTLLLTGGLTPVKSSLPLLNTTSQAPLPLGFRLHALDNAAAAPAEILVYDSTANPPTATRVMAPMAVQSVDGALQAAAELAGGGMALAGGVRFANGAMPQSLLATTHDGMAAQSGMLSQAREGAAMVGLRDTLGMTSTALLVGGVASGADKPPPFERLDLAGLTASALMSSLPQLPNYFLPTLTLMDDAGAAAARVLISGGLEVQSSGLTSNPPAGVTMFQVTYSPTAATLAVTAAALPDGFNDTCSQTLTHFKVVAFDAASLLPSGDRVFATGGTPRYDTSGMTKCNECEDGEGILACATGQAVMVSVPANSAATPTISPAGHLQFSRFGHTQSVLPDGNVLIAGGLTRRGGASWAVAQTEIFNPARVTPPPPQSSGSASVEADDPLRSELAKMALTRTPATQAFRAGSGSNRAAIACAAPSK